MNTKPIIAHVQCFTKIQQAQPSYFSTLINKEIGFNVNVELDQIYKIKDCVDSQQSNAQLYKRFSKAFLSNITNSINQLFLFCGNDTLARLQSSIGLKRNPGLFMIGAIGILDDKYQNSYVNYDVQVSFLEYNDGNFYDLLVRTGKPLQMIREQKNISFGQSYTPISTFDQFLKLFKIALFYNKERDFKSQKNISNQETKSTFILTIVTKLYENNNVKTQKNTFIDFGMSEGSSSKNVWEYFMIELNNLTNKKKMYYHLIEPNPLLCLIRHNLEFNKSFIIYSLSANPQKFKQNYHQLQEIKELVQSCNPIQIHKHHHSSEGQKELQTISSQLGNLLQILHDKNYTSLRQFRQLREECKKVIEEIKAWILKMQRIMISQLSNKCEIKFSQNLIVSYEIQLIGFCVKSDHYKDFYCAKSYISLERQVNKKTQQVRKQLQSLYKTRQNLYNKFSIIKYRDQNIKSNEIVNAVNELKDIGLKIYEYFNKISTNIVFSGERAVVNQILKQLYIKNSVQYLFKKLKDFIYGLYEYKKEKNFVSNTEICKDSHLYRLVREINDQRKVPRVHHKGKKEKENLKKIPKSDKCIEKGKFTKLPAIDSKITLHGSFRILDLLMVPDGQQ